MMTALTAKKYPKLCAVYEAARTVQTKGGFTTVNEFADQVPALRADVLAEAVQAIRDLGTFESDLLVTEEDKGAVLGGAVSLVTGMRLGVARWYTYALPDIGTVKVPMCCEYREGSLFLNGVRPGDRVTILEDTISTGGTIIALAEAVKAADGEVVEVLAVVEKVGGRGAERVRAALGVPVKSAIRITISPDGRVSVLDTNGQEG
jgi:adenine phosphoribosyltransferase